MGRPGDHRRRSAGDQDAGQAVVHQGQAGRFGQQAEAVIRKVPESQLVYKAAPGLALFVAERDAEAVGQPAHRLASVVPERVAETAVGCLFGRAAPGVTILIPQTDVIPITPALHPNLGLLFLKTEVSTGGARVDTLPFIDHTSVIGCMRTAPEWGEDPKCRTWNA